MNPPAVCESPSWTTTSGRAGVAAHHAAPNDASAPGGTVANAVDGGGVQRTSPAGSTVVVVDGDPLVVVCPGAGVVPVAVGAGDALAGGADRDDDAAIIAVSPAIASTTSERFRGDGRGIPKSLQSGDEKEGH